MTGCHIPKSNSEIMITKQKLCHNNGFPPFWKALSDTRSLNIVHVDSVILLSKHNKSDDAAIARFLLLQTQIKCKSTANKYNN